LLRGQLEVWSCAHHANPYITGVSWAPILPDAVRWGRAASSYGVISQGMSCVLVECPGSMSICETGVIIKLLSCVWVGSGSLLSSV
jgi:hypothetical protein